MKEEIRRDTTLEPIRIDLDGAFVSGGSTRKITGIELHVEKAIDGSDRVVLAPIGRVGFTLGSGLRLPPAAMTELAQRWLQNQVSAQHKPTVAGCDKHGEYWKDDPDSDCPTCIAELWSDVADALEQAAQDQTMAAMEYPVLTNHAEHTLSVRARVMNSKE